MLYLLCTTLKADLYSHYVGVGYVLTELILVAVCHTSGMLQPISVQLLRKL